MAVDEMFEGSAEPQEQNTQGDSETGQAVETPQPTGETVEAESATPDADDNSNRQVPLEALKSERKKRQAAEEHLRDLERKLAFSQGQQAAAAQSGNQEEAFEWTEDKVLEDMAGAFKTAESRTEELLRKERLLASHEDAQLTYDDYDQVMESMDEAAKAMPDFQAKVQRSKAPAKLAYREIKKYLANRDAPKLDAEGIEAEVQKRLQEEIAKLKRPAEIPSSLSSARGVGAATASGAVWNGPTPLDDIFGGR